MVLVALLGLLALFSRKYRRKPFAPCVEEDQQPANESSAELLSNLELGVVISQGRHGKMWKGSFNSKDVAVKIYTLEYRSLWQNEKNIHAAGLSHPNVLKVIVNYKSRGDLIALPKYNETQKVLTTPLTNCATIITVSSSQE